MARGRLITIEGLDGAGKSTLAAGARARASRPRRRRSSCCASRAASRSPSASATLVKDPRSHVDAARRGADLRRRARAARRGARCARCSSAGEWVLLDRFVDSSLAYQGAGRALGVDDGARDQRLRHRRPEPRPHAAAARSTPPTGARAPGRARGGPDRLEREDDAVLRGDRRRLRAPRRRRARPHPRRSTRAVHPASVLAAALAALEDLL